MENRWNPLEIPIGKLSENAKFHWKVIGIQWNPMENFVQFHWKVISFPLDSIGNKMKMSNWNWTKQKEKGNSNSNGIGNLVFQCWRIGKLRRHFLVMGEG